MVISSLSTLPALQLTSQGNKGKGGQEPRGFPLPEMLAFELQIGPPPIEPLVSPDFQVEVSSEGADVGSAKRDRNMIDDHNHTKG